MNSNAIIGASVIFFSYILFSWALGRMINRKKEPKPTEFKNFLAGAWVIGLFVVFGIIISLL